VDVADLDKPWRYLKGLTLSKKKTAKTKTERRFRGVSMPTSSHPAIRKVRRQGHEPTIHGNKLWKSSCLLIDYLKKNPPEYTDRVIDVGCGWGISGIWCAKNFGSDVTAVDADPSVFPFLAATAELNGVGVTPLVSRFEKLSKKKLAGFDMLIAADICFWDELVDPVYNMVNRAVKAGVKKIIIADPERPTFHEMAQRCVDKHGAEVIEWSSSRQIKASGALLVLENA
jgi:predicted nicotinamide N-methyase